MAKVPFFTFLPVPYALEARHGLDAPAVGFVRLGRVGGGMRPVNAFEGARQRNGLVEQEVAAQRLPETIFTLLVQLRGRLALRYLPNEICAEAHLRVRLRKASLQRGEVCGDVLRHRDARVVDGIGILGDQPGGPLAHLARRRDHAFQVRHGACAFCLDARAKLQGERHLGLVGGIIERRDSLKYICQGQLRSSPVCHLRYRYRPSRQKCSRLQSRSDREGW